jgi:hypothetical protein
MGNVAGITFLDLDGNGAANAGEAASGIEMLLVVGSGGIAGGATSDSTGLFVIDSVPVGSYRLLVNRSTLPTGARVLAGDSLSFVLAAGETVRQPVHVSFPTFTLAEVRALPPGLRVFSFGIALNARSPFGDGVVHLQSESAYLRTINVARAGFQAGDSLRVLGTTARSESQPVLTDVRPIPLVSQAVLVRPTDVRSRDAASARGGALDAALVRVRGAVVTDTVTAGADLLLIANDGTGPVEVLLRDFLNFNRAAFEPDSVLLSEGVGLLVPTQSSGALRWRLTPRGSGDLVLRPTRVAAP